jgi:hypothetical protein
VKRRIHGKNASYNQAEARHNLFRAMHASIQRRRVNDRDQARSEAPQ